MTEAKHPWVEDYKDFEAVLVCKNKLPEFMVDADLRAFQTFGWDDATTSGNDRTFTHAATGVIIRYEGPLVAIEYADERLTDALDDLFRALYGLGWRLADVYHPVSTMDRLLSDMGRKIPGSLHDFDLRAANDLDEVSDSAEGAALIEQGRKLMGGSDADQFHAGLLQEFADLENPPPQGAPVSQNFQPNTGPLFLDDGDGEFGNEFGFDDGVAMPSNQPVASTGGTAYSQFDEDETPRVFHPPGSAEALAQERAQRNTVGQSNAAWTERNGARGTAAQLTRAEPEQPKARTQIPIEIQQAPPVSIESLQPIPQTVEPIAQAPRSMEAPQSAEPLQRTQKEAGNSHVVRVGISAFCFSRPGAEMAPDAIATLAAEFGAAEIVHLRPGAEDAKIHWDVLGEFGADQPHLAEKIAGILSGVKKGNALLASVMLELRKANAKASLRDVLGKDYSSVQGGLLEEAFQQDIGPMKHTDCVEVMGAVIGTYGGVLLCEDGTTFVDHPKSSGCDLFTVREVMKSSKVSLFVVHEDSLDSPFVENIIGALVRLTRCYESSKRHTELVASNREVSAGEQKKAQMMQVASERLAATFRDLKAMGLTLPEVA